MGTIEPLIKLLKIGRGDGAPRSAWTNWNEDLVSMPLLYLNINAECQNIW